MTVEDITSYGEKIHIWEGDEILFNGIYTKDNPYAKRRICGAGYEEEIGSESEKWYQCIELK